MIHYKETQYGFEYGAASIIRAYSDDKKGWVAFDLKTPMDNIVIYVTKTGKVRIHRGDKELV